MLQIKYILLNEKENLKLYSEIINEVAREYVEFKNYRINNSLEGLLLEFDVNNKYRDFNLTFLKEDFEFEKNEKGIEYKVSYFNNEKDTNVKIIIDKYDDKTVRIQTLKYNKVINLLTISEEVETKQYSLTNYNGILLGEENKTINSLGVEEISSLALEHIGIKVGCLFNRSSKEILSRDLEEFIF